MLAQDLTKFGLIYGMFIVGFSQSYYIIYQTFEVRNSFHSNFKVMIDFFLRMRRMKEIL